jgi:hypothetical protein
LEPGYGWTSYRHDNLNSGGFNSVGGGFLSGNDFIIQNETISTNSNMFRYYTGTNINAGATVVNPPLKFHGPVIFTSGTSVTLKATNSVLLQDDVTIPIGCTFEIK